jgi:hypothetical protein
VKQSISQQSVRQSTISCSVKKGTGIAQSVLRLARAGRSGDRIPRRVRFSAPVQTDPGAHPASCIMDKAVSFAGEKRPERGVDHPPPSSAEVKDRVEL